MHSLVRKLHRLRLVLLPTTTNSSSSFSPSSTSTSTNTATTNLLSSPSTSSSSPSSPSSSPSSRPSPSSKNSAKKKRDSSSSLLADLSLFFRLFNLKMPTIVLLVSTLAFSVINAEPMYQRASYLSEGGGSLAYNPYSSNSVQVQQQRIPAASEARPSVIKKPKNAPSSAKNNKTASSVRRTPQWTTMESNPPPLPAALRGPETMQYHFKTNHAVMVGQGRQALSSAISSAENLTAEESQLRKEKRQIGGVVIQQSETIYDPNQQQNPNQITQQLDSSSSSDGSGGLGLKHYQCDSIIRDSAFLIESPQYPSTYPVNRICTYYIARSRGDVCQIELNIVDMDIEDTAQCTADYLDLGGGQPTERLCGLMLRNTKRQISFPTNNSSYIRVTFHSDGQNGRPYRGFSAEVRQLSNSCFYPYHGVANGSQPQQVMVYGQRLYPPARPLPPPPPPPQVWIGGPPGYPGARPEQQYPGPVVPGATPTGTLFPPYMVNSSWGGNPPSTQPLTPTFTFQQPQQPLPVQTTVNWSSGSSSVGVPGVVVQQQYPVTQVVSGRSNGSTSLNTGPVYLASYCDVFLGELSGELRSPGYPFGYPTNHSCIYTIRKAFDDVCQLELIFHHFDIQTPETGGGDLNNNNQPSNRRDLTDVCSGDYLELPDHSRLCGYYNQAMSRDHVLKKFYLFPDSSDYLFLQFLSDVHQRPDGSGFWLEARQLRNTCVPGAGGGGVLQPSFTSSTFPSNDSRPPKCDRLISGEFSTTERIYSPNYPNFYRPRSQCVYFIRPANERVCEFELDLANFQIEDSKPSGGNSVVEHCNKDFLQLPDRTRICGRSNFRRIFSFPKYHDRTAMLYFSADEQVEDRGYEIVVRQLANSCTNSSGGGGYYPNTIATNLNPTGTAAGGNTQNVYIVNDPNIPQQQQPQSNHPRYSPTPVFTYHNSSGIQPAFPYQPIYNPGSSTGGIQPQTVITQVVPSSKTFGFGNGKKMSPLGPSYSLVPNVLNDPRNVDSSGTIPLYYANGSLATRVPPLKPVDMITFLKKGGKTFSVQKGGFSGGGTSPALVSGGSYAGFDGLGGGGKGFSIGNANYQPFGRLNQASGGSGSSGSGSFTNRGFGSSNSLLSSDPQQLTPSYNCDQVLSRPVEYIRSPNYPSNYPPVTRCIYTLLKAEPSVCQVRLHLLALDLEYTTGCRSDYLQIETTGEKLCGRLAGPETRTINFFGSARDVRLIFNSDRQLTAPGFEVRVEQVPNSCDSLENSISNSNLSLASVATLSRIPNPNSNQIDPRAARLININSGGNLAEAVTTSPMAAALSFSNRSGRLQGQETPTTTTPARLCSTSAALETFFETENFPNAYPTNTDCLFKIFRASRNVCRLEIELQAFDVGNEIYDSSSSSNSNSLSPSGRSSSTTCPNDFLEIDQVKYCGRRPGQQIAVNFPRYAQEVAFRFLSISPDPFNGFRVRVQQIDKNCRSAASTAASNSANSNSLFSGSSANSDELAEFSPATIESCSKIESPGSSFPGSSASSSASSSPTAISERIIRIQSPKYGLATNLGYEPFLDCDYLVQRYSRDVCALEVKFEAFNVEESRACSKDYLEINGNVNSRMCGKMPVDTIRNFEFATETLRIHFHSDAERNDTGFAMVLKQIRC